MNNQENQYVENEVATPAGLRQILISTVYSMNIAVSEGQFGHFDSVIESYRQPLIFSLIEPRSRKEVMPLPPGVINPMTGEL